MKLSTRTVNIRLTKAKCRRLTLPGTSTKMTCATPPKQRVSRVFSDRFVELGITQNLTSILHIFSLFSLIFFVVYTVHLFGIAWLMVELNAIKNSNPKPVLRNTLCALQVLVLDRASR